MDRDARCERGNLGRANLCGDVLGVKQDAASFEGDLDAGCHARRLAWIVGVRIGALHRESDAAIHGPGIEVGNAERIGEPPRHRGLAGTSGAVDRDHHEQQT